MPSIRFEPSGTTIDVSTGTSLLQACRMAGLEVSTPCAEKGFCGKCRVKILSGTVPADQAQKACLPAHLLAEGWRASCIVRVENDLTVADPVRSEPIVLSDFSCRDAIDDNPMWECELDLAQPSQRDQTDDLTRVLRALPETLPLHDHQPCISPLLSRLPHVLRSSDFHCRAIGIGGWLLDIVPGKHSGDPTGLAIDIGTTTIAVALCRLRDGEVLATASRANPQSTWGDDVISRIECAGRGREVIMEMRSCVMKTLESLSTEACELAAVDDPPVLASVAANTVMAHLFVGVPPASLAVSPFAPVFRGGMAIPGAEIGWSGDTPPLFWILPGVSAFVGGDMVAGMLVHNLHHDSGVTLLLDAGTNGEIALSVHGQIFACSTAAGPAFEGARIGQGMRAAPGAISRVALAKNGDIDVGVVDSLPPRGICGTGLLDAVAALRLAGAIDEYGRIVEPDEEGVNLSPSLAARMTGEEGGKSVRLSSGNGQPEVFLTQKDVREFQLAKGAIAAGIRVLCNVAGVELGDMAQVLLAGGFGNYLDPRSTVVSGLLPPGISVDVVRPVGNAALAGARLCLLSSGERRVANELAGKVEHVELAGRSDFQQIFAEEMMFPELESGMNRQ